MSFSLKKYIKEKYLNESIQSDILIKEILYDKGGFFKYYKMPFENSQYKRLVDTVGQMLVIIEGMCNSHISPHIRGYKVEKDEDARYVHEKYNQLLKKYISTLENIFSKPEPRILATLFTYKQLTSNLKLDLKKGTYLDIYNITDDNFTTYTWDEMQSCDVVEQEDIQNLSKNKPTFWIDYSGKIQAFSNSGKILLFAPDNNNQEILKSRGYKNNETLPDDIKKYLSKQAIEDNMETYYYELNDRSTLEFNYPKYEISNGSSIMFLPLIGLRYILNTYDLTEYSFYHDNLFDVDNIFWKTSPIRKYTPWGKHPADKIIIYQPTMPYNKDGNRSKNVVKRINPDTDEIYYTETNMQLDSYYGNGYNEHKHDRGTNARVADRKEAFELSYNSRYKWVKNLLGKYVRPYTAFGKENPKFKLGVSLTDEERYHLYDSDEYCSKLAYDNYKRYRYIVDKHKNTEAIVSDITTELNDILQKTKGLSAIGVTLNNRIKQMKRTPLFPDAINLYGMYMKGLRKCLTFISTVLGSISNYMDKYENPQHKIIKSDYEDLDPDYKKITNSLERLRGYIKSLKEICDEINAKINEAE